MRKASTDQVSGAFLVGRREPGHDQSVLADSAGHSQIGGRRQERVLLGQDGDGAGRYFRVGGHRWIQQRADGGGASGGSSKDGGGNGDGCGGNGLQQLGTFVGQGLRTKDKKQQVSSG